MHAVEYDVPAFNYLRDFSDKAQTQELFRTLFILRTSD